MIGYFGVNAYTGNHGLRAKQDLDQQFAALSERTRPPQAGARRVAAPGQAAASPSSIDPDMLDERARAVLNYLDPRDLTLMLKRP